MSDWYDHLQGESGSAGGFKPEVGQCHDPRFLEDDGPVARTRLEKRADFVEIGFPVAIVERHFALKPERGIVPAGSVSTQEVLVEPHSFERLPVAGGVTL